MNKQAVVKFAGLFVGSLLLLTVGFFFVFPYINEERYNEIMESFSDEEVMEAMFEGDRRFIGIEFNELSEQLEKLRKEKRTWDSQFDSLNSVNRNLSRELEEVKERNAAMSRDLEEMAVRVADTVSAEAMQASANEAPEELSERLKSLLNLDEEELGPIVNQLSNEHLVRIYRTGGNMQREKLLRTLKPERAAEIVREIML